MQEETEVQVSEEDQVELEELSTPGQGQSSTDKTNTGATGVSAAKRSLDKQVLKILCQLWQPTKAHKKLEQIPL